MDPFMILALIALFGLAFVLLIGRPRQTSRGTIEAPAPGSPDSPLFKQPEQTPTRTRPERKLS